jgi:hypothetical protein
MGNIFGLEIKESNTIGTKSSKKKVVEYNTPKEKSHKLNGILQINTSNISLR